MLPPNLIRSHK